MPLSVIGLSHTTAPVEVREAFSLSGEQLDNALFRLRSLVGECVVLSTCNRFELYVIPAHGRSPDAVLRKAFEQASRAAEYTYSYEGLAAAEHLFRVAAGVDSLVLGEVQILGQVQRAWQSAHEASVAGPVLSQLFNKAVALGKRVHSETSISRRPASVSYAAVVLARQIFGEALASRRVLVIGTGEVGEGVARCLYDYGLHTTIVAHQQLERASRVARRYEADVATWDQLPTQLASADIVISSTAAPHIILQRQQIEEALQQRHDRPLYLIDLAIPRDIEPSAAHLDNVFLHNLDDLAAVVRASLAERESALPEVEVMIDEEVRNFGLWMKARSAFPAIKQLQVEAQQVADSELQWAMSKLPDLSPRERRVVEMLATRITGKLLHGPIRRLKAQAEESPGRREPGYGLDTLTPAQLASLFYRDNREDSENEERQDYAK